VTSAATSHEGSVRERPHRGQRRRGMLCDLAAVAGRLSDDELHVLLTIAVRAWVGQSNYGCLQLASDRRDFRHEALEEACDATFYLAAALLSAQKRRPGRSKRRGHRDGRPSSSVVRG
jgi:hypothetical protein